MNIFNKRNGKSFGLFLTVFALAVVIAASVLLSSCDNKEATMRKKLAELTENCVVLGANVDNVDIYDLYLKYFNIFPEKFDGFYEECLKDKEKNRYDRFELYIPQARFEVEMPDGKLTDLIYNFGTQRVSSDNTPWGTYEYRFYEFDGIYTEKEGGTLVLDGSLNNVSGIALESLFKGKFYVRLKPTAVRVVLDTDGGELSMDTEFSVRIGESLIPYMNEIPEKEGYNFIGWEYTIGKTDYYPIARVNFLTVQDQSTCIMNDTNFQLVNARDEGGYNISYGGTYEGQYSTDWYVTLKAKYEQRMHTVTYMNSDGTVYKTKSVAYGTVLTQYNTEVLSSYSCKGWSLTDGSGLIFDTVTVDGDITLYPVVAKSKTVTLYFSNGFTVTCTVYETYPLMLNSVVPSGYGLEGWYYDAAHTRPVQDEYIFFDGLADAYYAVIN